MEHKVRKIIVDQAEVDLMDMYGHKELADHVALEDDLGLDSLDCIELTMTFEEEFGLEIPDEEAEAWETVGDIVAYLKGKV